MSVDFLAAVRARMLASADISNDVGSRVHTDHLPQATTYPAITYQKISGGKELSLSGPGRIRTARVQIDTWAETRAKSEELAEYVLHQFHGFKGTVGGVYLAVGAVSNDGTGMYEDGIDKYRVSADFEIIYWSA